MESPASTPVGTKRKRRRNTARLLGFDDLDRRTATYREAKRLVGALESDLGGADQLSTGERQLVQRVAVLGSILTELELRWFRGERPYDLLGYCTVVNAQRRVLEAVGLRRRARDVTRLASYVINAPPEAEAAE